MESSPVVPDAPWLDEASDRVHVAGADAGGYLQSQLSQEIRDFAVGERRWTFLLQPTGKVDVLARIKRTADDEFVLETDPGFGATMLARVDRFKIRVAATTTLHVADDVVPSHEDERVHAGWPRMGVEIVPGETIPAETGVTGVAVNFRKGCYPGQELVERMDSRGAAAPRSLRWIDVGDDARPGDAVLDADGTDVGVLTSVSGDLALGYVRRSADVGRPISHPTTGSISVPADGVD